MAELPSLFGPFKFFFSGLTNLKIQPFPVQAGFPSPAEDYMMAELDLNELLLSPRESTFGFYVQGESMSEAGIHTGDILIVNTEADKRIGDNVVAGINNEWVVKTLGVYENQLALLSQNPDYGPIMIHEGDDVRIFGVARHVVHSFRKRL